MDGCLRCRMQIRMFPSDHFFQRNALARDQKLESTIIEPGLSSYAELQLWELVKNLKCFQPFVRSK